MNTTKSRKEDLTQRVELSLDSIRPYLEADGGNVLLTGFTDSPDFPTKNASQPTIGGNIDAFVTKFTPAGALVYSTFLGGSAADRGNGIVVDGAGSAYVAGSASSLNFPTTAGAPQTTLRGTQDAFVARLTAGGGNLSFSTYLGGTGTEAGVDVTVESAGIISVAG